MVFLAIAAGIFILETAVKGHVEANDTGEKEVWGGRILLLKYHNQGAFLNLGAGKRRAVMAVSVLLTLLLTILFILTLGRSGKLLLKTGLALLLGGAYSNTYDRLKRKYVVDYFSFRIKKGPFKKLSNIVFNIADFCILAGAMLAVFAAS